MSERRKPEESERTWKIRPSEPSSVEARSQKRDLLAEQQANRAADHPAPLEQDLEGRPTDLKADADAASLLVAEVFQRREPDEPPRVDDHEKRLPEHGGVLATLMRYQDFIHSLGGSISRLDRRLRLPAEGEELFGFRLRQSLGHGAFARVYLAEQPDLACRPVVLKVSATEGSEHHTLARLQHTNIVPIFSVHEDERTGLRAVCMPYFGGGPLSRVLDQLWAKTPQPTLGGQLVEALEEVGSPVLGARREEPGSDKEPEPRTDEPPAESQTPLALMRGLSYYRAVGWIVAQLAEGLHHAHQRGILHRDVKPSNILLSAEGQPLLLDFNVAQEMTAGAAEAILGGTVAYAAPEHLAALRDCTRELIQRVDRRSDLYSLGLVLAEMVTGGDLFEQGGSYSACTTQLEVMVVERSQNTPSLRQVRRDVPWTLESIAHKCLDPDPTRRYQQGDHLADDLRRFLEDRPLKYAPELSRVEQVQKFFRRHPRLTTSGSVLAAAMLVLLMVGASLMGTRLHLAEARTQLGKAQAQERKRAHHAGAVRALCLVNTTLSRQDHLRQGIAVCEETLALYRVPDGRLFNAHPDWSNLAAEDRCELAEDRRELLLLLAGARVRLARGDRPTLVHSLALLDEAEVIPGLRASKALWLDRASYLSQLGQADRARIAQDRARTIPTSTARQHYLLATSYSRHGGASDYRKAIAELNHALNLQPRHYWSAMQRGICHMELGEFAQAVGDFGTCIGLWPEHSWGYFNRGYVLDRMGMKAEAIDDYTAALDRDRSFVAALVNRGLARLELKQPRRALTDFDEALAMGGQGDASLFAGRGLALEVIGRHAEADSAFQQAFALAPHPDPAHIRLNWTYGFAVSARLPEQAQEAFDDVLRHDPQHPQALYGQAMLAMNRGDVGTALQFFNRALEANPGFTEARRYRAVVLSRKGDWEHATRDINWCLDREPRSGETLYAAACVAARAAEASPSPRSFDVAFDLLERAWSLGVGQKANSDPDLTVLGRDPRFARLMATAVRTNDRIGPRARSHLHFSHDTNPKLLLATRMSMLALHNVPGRSRRIVATDRVKALSSALREEFDTSFLFYDGSTGELLGAQDAREPQIALPRQTEAEILAIAGSGRPHASLRSNHRYRLVLPIQDVDGPLLVAIGELPAVARSAQDSRLEQARLRKWLQSVHSRLSFTGWPPSQSRNDKPYQEQLKTLLEASREVNELLGILRSSGDSSKDPNHILQRVAAVLSVTTLIWVPPGRDETPVIEGDCLLSAQDCCELASRLSKSPEWDPSGYLILNDVRSCGLGARFPGISNLMAVSVDEPDARGCLIALNKSDATTSANRSHGRDEHMARVPRPANPPDGPIADRREAVPFRRIDAAVFMPFGSLLGLQSRGSRRQSQVQELFAGLIRSLTAAIDAKDSYTRGHSERVARIAVELGRDLELSELELGDLYLGGLLHDIGKIGVPDSVLCKRGPLTSEEFLQIRQHVLIGCRILGDFREISHLLPLVRSHHERFDGMGYPHGLSGEAIPPLARILAVADCYDAMNTRRPYRDALVRDRIEKSLEEGRNRQWDGKVVDAFFRARERIYSVQQRGVGVSAWFALNSAGERLSPGSSSQWLRPMSS